MKIIIGFVIILGIIILLLSKRISNEIEEDKQFRSNISSSEKNIR